MSASTHELACALQALVGPHGVLTGSDTASYEIGARYGLGRSACVVRPATTAEVSRVVAFCVTRGIRIVLQGANTGLVGASTPDETGSQVVLSLSRLNKEFTADVANRSVTVAAGMLLQELNERLEPHGLWFPIDLGANPSIGGMVATNTGGTRLIRYGDVRHNLLAVEVVLFDPPGEVVRLGRSLRKDNTGLDLKQLFVGNSGTAGVITQATLEVHARPRQSATALVVPSSDDAVIALLVKLERELGDFVSAFEGISGRAMQAAIDHVPDLRNPFAPDRLPNFAVLIELESSSSPAFTGIDLPDTLNRFLEDCFGEEVLNAVIGSSAGLWHLRHAISEGARGIGRVIAFDVSVPRSSIMAFCREARSLVQKLAPHLTVVDFGHIADGGVHFNLVWPKDARVAFDPVTVQRLRDDIYALAVDRYHGSYSAEHGIGPHNLAYYRRYTPRAALDMAHQIQRLLDPQSLCGVVSLGLGGEPA
jgi:FAD/FMN-containing dehydrogenase